MDRLNPAVLVDVEEDDVRVKLPVRPTPAEFLGSAGDRGRIAYARIDRGLVVGCKLA